MAYAFDVHIIICCCTRQCACVPEFCLILCDIPVAMVWPIHRTIAGSSPWERSLEARVQTDTRTTITLPGHHSYLLTSNWSTDKERKSRPPRLCCDKIRLSLARFTSSPREEMTIRLNASIDCTQLLTNCDLSSNSKENRHTTSPDMHFSGQSPPRPGEQMTSMLT